MMLYCFGCGKVFKENNEGDKCPKCHSNETFETELEEERD